MVDLVELPAVGSPSIHPSTPDGRPGTGPGDDDKNMTQLTSERAFLRGDPPSLFSRFSLHPSFLVLDFCHLVSFLLMGR